MTLDDWADHHSRLFGLTGEQTATVLSWLPIFDRAGWTGAELMRATDWLLTHDAPQWFPKDHLDGLKARIMAGRAATAPPSAEELTGADAVCVRCGNAYRLVVPDLRFIRGGQWVPMETPDGGYYPTCAVRCSCTRGQKRHLGWREINGVKHDLQQLHEYELANPSWQRQLEARRREEIALAELDPPPAKEEGLNEVLAALRDRCRMPGEDDREPDGGAGEWREGGAGW